MGIHVRIPLDYHTDRLVTRLQHQAVVYVCSRDSPREAVAFLVVACRPPDRDKRLFVFAGTVEEPFSAGGISALNDTVCHAAQLEPLR
jgi:hypothetical protein